MLHQPVSQWDDPKQTETGAEHTVNTMPQHHMGSWMLTSHV